MITLTVIQENNQEDICKRCEDVILGQSSLSLHYQCEGRWCEDANQMYYEENPEKATALPEFPYEMSDNLKNREAELDRRIAAWPLKFK